MDSGGVVSVATLSLSRVMSIGCVFVLDGDGVVGVFNVAGDCVDCDAPALTPGAGVLPDVPGISRLVKMGFCATLQNSASPWVEGARG